MESSSTAGAPEIVDVGEAFDLRSAAQVFLAAKSKPRGVELIIDFSRARAISDAALVVLIRMLKGLSLRPRALGLRRHHYNLLQYMGLGSL